MSKTSGYSEKAKAAIAKIGKGVAKKKSPRPTALPEYVEKNWDPKPPSKPEDFEDMPPLKPITPPQKDRPPTLKPKPQSLGTKAQPPTSSKTTEAPKKTEIKSVKPEAYGTYKEVRGDEDLKRLAIERGTIKFIKFSDLRFHVEEGIAEDKQSGAEYKYVSEITAPEGDYSADFFIKIVALRWALQVSHPLVINPVAVSSFATEKSTSLYILYPREAFEEIIPFEQFQNFSTRVSISLLALLFQLADIFKDSGFSGSNYGNFCLASTSSGPRFLVPFLGNSVKDRNFPEQMEFLFASLDFYSKNLGVNFDLTTDQVKELIATDQIDGNIASIIQFPKNGDYDEAIRKCLLSFLNIVRLVNPEDIKRHSRGHPLIDVRGKYYGSSRPIIDDKFRKEVRYISDPNFPYKEDYQRRLRKLGSLDNAPFANRLMDFGTELIYRLTVLRTGANAESYIEESNIIGLGSMLLPFMSLHLLLLEDDLFESPDEIVKSNMNVTEKNKNPALLATYPPSVLSKSDFAGAHQHLLQRNGFNTREYENFFLKTMMYLGFAY